MNKQEVIEGLGAFRERLLEEVMRAYQQRGRSFGRDRFNSWRKRLAQFLNDHMPGEVETLNSKLSHVAYVVRAGESDAERFWRQDGEPMVSYLDSLILDVENDEFQLTESVRKPQTPALQDVKEFDFSKVFVVHGHDDHAKERTARFVEKLGLTSIVLHEQASRGRTIIEKIEEYSNVGFAIVLYSPDDLGNAKTDAENGELKGRARQNVILEHGYLMGKLGRENVVPLVIGKVELPNDISGMVYISDKDWKVDVAREMKDAGYDIDFNKLL